MRSIKVMALIAVIVLFVGVAVVSDALAGEKGRVAVRDVFFSTNYVSAKVPDAEGHAVHFIEAKGMSFSEKWGACLLVMVAAQDYTKGVGPYHGYIHYTYHDASTITIKIEGEGRPGQRGEGTWSYTKGTGKFEGIQGGGTREYWVLGPGQWYVDAKGEYTLP
ncbi:MAG: hypothetical protein QHH30_01545 [candidate division NC10 bacterium]|nr:hypothetical protein [candidate division NC10 bacterium]